VFVYSATTRNTINILKDVYYTNVPLVLILLMEFYSDCHVKYSFLNKYFYFLWLCSPAPAMASSTTRFLDHTQRRATDGRTPMDE
jgi:hypothetical protein